MQECSYGSACLLTLLRRKRHTISFFIMFGSMAKRTQDSESCDPISNLGGTFANIFLHYIPPPLYCRAKCLLECVRCRSRVSGCQLCRHRHPVAINSCLGMPSILHCQLRATQIECSCKWRPAVLLLLFVALALLRYADGMLCRVMCIASVRPCGGAGCCWPPAPRSGRQGPTLGRGTSS